MTTYTAKFREHGCHARRHFLALSMRIGSDVFGDPLQVRINWAGHESQYRCAVASDLMTRVAAEQFASAPELERVAAGHSVSLNLVVSVARQRTAARSSDDPILHSGLRHSLIIRWTSGINGYSGRAMAMIMSNASNGSAGIQWA